MNKYAEVLINLHARALDRTFQYRVPEELREGLRVGHAVLVPFGSRKQVGFVVSFSEQPQVEKLKDIAQILDPHPLFNSGMVELAKWLSARTLCLLVDALRAAFPAGKNIHFEQTFEVAEKDGIKLSEGERTFRELIQNQKTLKSRDIRRMPSQQRKLFRTLLRKSIIAAKSRLVSPRLKSERTKKQKKVFTFREPETRVETLTEHQEGVLQDITRAAAAGKHEVFLLAGVTGSGKTEVYLRAIDQIVKLGKQAIVLVPEIALTPQTEGRFRQKFKRVAVLHSHLPLGVRFHAHRDIQRGEIDVVVGARSAVFAPVPNLGMIIVDEEHEPAYKQDVSPRYHARDVALYRSKQSSAILILGSATPSLESYHGATLNHYHLKVLPDRIYERPLPTVHMVDMREEWKTGNRDFLSKILQEKLLQSLSRGEQVILFLNRRGYSSFVLCRECGHVLRCPNCTFSLTFHLAYHLLICHGCNFRRRPPAVCPSCGGGVLDYRGTGTQKVQQEVEKLFPQVKAARLDSDTARSHYVQDEILSSFQQKVSSILLGTQMIAKGHDFPGVTLVGVVNADTSLHFPDFRSSERTFQLLTQVAGRAGRGEQKGEVIIQTYNPHHTALQAARSQNYQAFFKTEIQERESLFYPPFSRLLRVVAEGPENEKTFQVIKKMKERILKEAGERRVTVLGPSPCPYFRVRKKFRYHLLLKGGKEENFQFVVSCAKLLPDRENVSVILDADVVSLL